MGMSCQWPLFFVPLGVVFGIVRGLDHVVPVLVWGEELAKSEQLAANPLTVVSGDQFFGIFADVTRNYTRPILIYVKEDFCVEDLSQLKRIVERVRAENILYLPSVVMPLMIFEDARLSSSYKIIAHPANVFPPNVSIAITAVENLGKIPSMNEKLRWSRRDRLTGVTGKSCRYYENDVRVQDIWDSPRSRGDFQDDRSITVSSGSILFYSKNGPFVKTSAREDFKELWNPSTRIERRRNPDDEYTVLQMSFDQPTRVTVRFLFAKKYAGYYTLSDVEYVVRGNDTVILRARRDISFPRRMSYHCTTGATFSNGHTTLRLTKFQVRLDPEDATFGNVYDCEGFMSIPIISGLFVCSILIGTLIVGLTMLLGIRTMDRFEDAKSKNIIIPKT